MFRTCLLFCALSAMVVFTAGPAAAQTSRIYIAGYMGLNTFGDQEFSESTGPASGEFSFKNSTSFAGALGLRLSNNLRVEAELSYSTSDLNAMKVDGAGTFKTGDDISSWLGLVNVYYDFDTPWKLQPFVGAGLGLGWFDATINDASGVASSAAADDMALAWQVGGGLKYRMNPDLALTGGYRYVGSYGLNFDAYDMDYAAHEFRIGLEYDLPVARK